MLSTIEFRETKSWANSKEPNGVELGSPKAGTLVGVGCDPDGIAHSKHTLSSIDGPHSIMALGGKTGFVGRDDFGRALLVSSTPLVRLLHHVCRALPNGGSPR